MIGAYNKNISILLFLHGDYRFNMNAKPPPTGQLPCSEAGTVDASNGLLRKVMVVDDEPDVADLAVELLTAHGLNVFAVYSAHAAMQALKQDNGIDAVFSDVMMPEMTGLQLADAIREMYPRVKVVLTSGYTLPKLLKDRDLPYLFAAKPYRISVVLKLLQA